MKETFKFIGRLLMLPLFFLLVFTVARWVACRPDSSVERVAFPLAKSIVEHIEKKGIPETLNDVEGVPYDLECGIEKTIEHNQTDLYTKKEYVRYTETFTNCSFINKKKNYGVFLRTEVYRKGTIGVHIDITYEKTLVRYVVVYRKNQWKYENYPNAQVGFGYGKRTGFCKPIRFVQ